MGKTEKSAADALAALGVGATEQTRRMRPEPLEKVAAPRFHTSVEFTAAGVAILQKVQARLLERGTPRAGVRGVAIEVALAEWLALQS